jgi:hypothetical protein
MAEQRRDPAETSGTVMDAPALQARAKTLEATQAADLQRLAALQQQALVEDLTFEEQQEVVVLTPRTEARKPRLEAARLAAEQAQEQVDIAAVQEGLTPIIHELKGLYGDLEDIQVRVCAFVRAFKTTHQRYEARLQELPVKLQRKMLDNFWVDEHTALRRLATQAGAGWPEVLCAPTGPQVVRAEDLAANDPGVTMPPARLIENFLTGRL